MRTQTTIKGNRTWIFPAIAALAALALVIMACGGADSANSGSKVNGASNNTSTSASSQHFKVSDQVKVGDTYVVTVNSVKTSNGDDISQPKSGNTFLVLDVTIKNTSSKEQDFSSDLQFTLKDATGQKYDQTILSGATPPDGKIAAGDLLRGQMAFEVPKSQQKFTLAFEADIISGGQTIWDINA